MPERAVVLDPQPCSWSAETPSPVVLSSELRTFVVLDQPDDSPAERRVLAVEFVGCLAITSGFPNDEVLHGHRLWDRGLSFYQVHEVINSAWLDEVRAIERHHPRSVDHPFASTQHFVLTFHDSTIEALATGLDTAETFDSAAHAIAEVSRLL